MAHYPELVKALFLAAIERVDRADRQSFLDQEVGENSELRLRLDALLAAYDQPPGALERPLGANLEPTEALDGAQLASSSRPSKAPEAGLTANRSDDDGQSVIDTIIADRYKIRQAIGEGGMGTVFFAEQLRPVRRQVALKLIKRGMDSRTVLARFESERQALALMEHPNIARVLDAGTTADGRPFFVMELVKGIPITEYCDAHRLDLGARLAIFRQVCSAVQHAHQKGIIHRDLKPSNILVESHDDNPVPKVIDFGLAKATSGMRLTDQSLFTAFGSVAGTPLYMAPEQASFNALDIDTRADIYALGVILYELLVGSTPIARESMRKAALDEMLRVIREVEPPTPSNRISTSEALPSLAAARQVEPARLSRLIRGDLDWIVMKALAKERERRYASATGLADDVERFLNHEPVSAGPPTAAYWLRKFVQRNRVQVAAAGLVLLALVVGVAGTTLGLLEARLQARRARQQEALAVAEAKAKEQARAAEAEQRGQAEKRLGQVTKMNDILGSIFKDLDPMNAAKESKPLSAVLGERLDRATAEIEGEATGDPLAVARMQTTLGTSQVGLGYPDRAIALFSRARTTFTAELGPDNPETLGSMNNLANSYSVAGEIDRALKLHEETLALRRAKLGPDHLDTLWSMHNLADSYRAAGQNERALKLLEETLALRKAKLGADHVDTLITMSNLAVSYEHAGQSERTLKLREETLALQKAKLGADHPDTLKSMNNLANSYYAMGQHERALKLREETLTLQKAKLGPDHPDTLRSMANLAHSYQVAGHHERAVKLLEEALSLRKAKLSPDHPDTLASMNNLAIGYHAAGQYERALKLHEETLALQKAMFGLDHHDTLASMNNLANCYQDTGQHQRAIKLREETLALQKSKLGPDHPVTLGSMYNLAISYDAAGQTERALKLREETLALRKTKLGPEHPDTLMSMNNLANGYHDVGQHDRALKLREETLALWKAKLGPEHPGTLGSMYDLAISYRDVGQIDRALNLFEETLALRKAKIGSDHPNTLMTMGALAICHSDAGQHERAMKLFDETLALMKKKFGPDHPLTAAYLGLQADCLANSGELDRAVAILDQVIAARRKTLGESHPNTFLARIDRAALDLVCGRSDAALAAGQTILKECRSRLGVDDSVTVNAGLALARVREARGDRDAAAPLYRAALESARKHPADRETLATALTESGRSRLAAADWAMAESQVREALAIREVEKHQHWQTAEARSLVGGILWGQKKTTEAAPLLRSGYEGMARSAAAIPLVDRPRLAAALDRLIAAGEAAGTKAELAVWKSERVKLATGGPKP
jgi:eukaryotic-like serine/threonine-protein kinase